MKRARSLILVLCGLLVASIALGAQANRGDSIEPYLLLDTKRMSTLEEELERALSQGFRLRKTWTDYRAGTDKLMFLDRSPEPAPPMDVQIFTAQSVAELRAQLERAGKDGARLLPSGMFVRRDGGILFALARTRGAEEAREYRITTFYQHHDYRYRPLPTAPVHANSVFEPRLVGALETLPRRGYAIVALLSRSTDTRVSQEWRGMKEWIFRRRTGEYIVIWERRADAEFEESSRERYCLVGGTPAELRDALNDAADSGYRLLFATQPLPPDSFQTPWYELFGDFGTVPVLPVPGLVGVMRMQGTASEPYRYRVLESESSGLVHRLTGASGEGFRLVPGAMFSHPFRAVLEREPGERLEREYRTLETFSSTALLKSVNESAQEGFVVVDIGVSDRKSYVVVLERASR